MPISVIGTGTKKKKEPEKKEWAARTKFVVVGYEHERRIPHFVTIKDEVTGEERTENIILEGNDITAKDLKDFGIDINDWIVRGLIALAQTYKGWYPETDLEAIGILKDIAPPEFQRNSE